MVAFTKPLVVISAVALQNNGVCNGMREQEQIEDANADANADQNAAENAAAVEEKLAVADAEKNAAAAELAVVAEEKNAAAEAEKNAVAEGENNAEKNANVVADADKNSNTVVHADKDANAVADGEHIANAVADGDMNAVADGDAVWDPNARRYTYPHGRAHSTSVKKQGLKVLAQASTEERVLSARHSAEHARAKAKHDLDFHRASSQQAKQLAMAAGWSGAARDTHGDLVHSESSGKNAGMAHMNSEGGNSNHHYSRSNQREVASTHSEWRRTALGDSHGSSDSKREKNSNQFSSHDSNSHRESGETKKRIDTHDTDRNTRDADSKVHDYSRRYR